MHGGHETLNDAPSVVDDLGEGCEAVGGAGGIGNNLKVGGVLGVVHTNNEHGGVVLGWGGDDDLLGAWIRNE